MGLFSRNKRLTPAKPLDDAQQEALAVFKKRFDEAANCVDPGKKLLSLELLKTDIERHVSGIRRSIADRAQSRSVIPALTCISGGLAVGVALAAAIHFPPLALIAIGPGAVGGASLDEWRQNKIRRRLTDENQQLLEALQAQGLKASNLAEAMMSKDLPAITQSRYFPIILDAVPGLCDRFMVAIQRGELMVAKKPDDIPPKRPGGGFRL